MKTFTTYILHSKTIDRYYIGYTTLLIEDRIAKHNTNHKGFTGKTNDWTLAWSSVAATKTQAIQAEKKIKKRGANRFLEDLAAQSG
jgi:putative endonuclease